MGWQLTNSVRCRITAIALTAGLVLGFTPCAEFPSKAEPQSVSHAVEIAMQTPAASAALAAPAGPQIETLDRLGVTAWHAAGYRGKDMKIAVLDSGFRNYRSQLGKALPNTVLAKSFRRDGDLEARDSQHGILCAEVIHTLAPEAQILLANWDTESPASFLQAVRWAREQGARIISCSLIMPSWSDGEGGGQFSANLARVLGTGQGPSDPLFFVSAGNTAQRHWTGTLAPDKSGFHLWSPAHRNNIMTPWSTDRVSVEIYGQGSESLLLQVLDTVSGKVIGSVRATSAGSPGGCPFAAVRFTPETGCHYVVQVKVAPTKATAPEGKFHLVVLGGNLKYATAAGSIACPADCPRAQAVGAVDEKSRPLYYSSCGPNSLLPKPDFVAEVPFPSGMRARSFTGTSAAAPQAAGLTALLWGMHPEWNADQAQRALQSAARDLGPLGHDWQTGHGLIHLPGAPVREANLNAAK